MFRVIRSLAGYETSDLSRDRDLFVHALTIPGAALRLDDKVRNRFFEDWTQVQETPPNQRLRVGGWKSGFPAATID